MSEENTPLADGQPAADQQSQQSEFKPITSQEELNKLIGERIGKVKSQFADYEDLKTKASEFDKIAEAQKSELQKAQERADAAEKRALEFEQTALKTRIASEMGVIPEVIQGSDEETMRASAQRVLDWANQGKRTPPAPKKLASGSAPEPKGGETGRAAAALRALRQG
jgi:hypothetical protein